MDVPKLNFERKLLTILSADVAGYSRLMAEQEERTLGIFVGHKKVFEEQVALHKGRIFNTAGDAILAEFPSAVEGLRCAIKIQEILWEMNKTMAPASALNFRIGLNVGDVMVQGTDLMGDGVNVAARVQTAAMPGGVCISGSVYDQIQGKLDVPLIFAGEKLYKNIPHPVRTFAITFPGRKPIASGARAAPTLNKSERKQTMGIGSLLFLIPVILAGYVFSGKTLGFELTGAVCSIGSTYVPAELVEPALNAKLDKVSVFRKSLHCTLNMQCYSKSRPWIGFAMRATGRSLPFTADTLYVQDGQPVSAFVTNDQSTIRFRAMEPGTDGNARWSSQECISSAKVVSIYPNLHKLFAFFK